MASRILIALLTSITGALVVLPVQAAPRDAVAQLPEIVHDTTITTINTERNGVVTGSSEEFVSIWDIGWRSQTIRLDDADVTWSLRYQTILRDILDSNLDRRHDRFEYSVDLDAGPLSAFHAVQREDTAISQSDFAGLISKQIDTSRLTVELPAYTTTSFTQLKERNYDGEQGPTARGSEVLSTLGTFEYRPPKVQLEQYIELRKVNVSRDNPRNQTSSSTAETSLRASRDIELGSLGKMTWQLDYREESNNLDIAGLGLSQVATSAQTFSLVNRRLHGTPIGYSVKYLDFTKDVGELAPESVTSAEIELRVEPLGSASTSLSFNTGHIQTVRPGLNVDTTKSSNRVLWNFRPHPRIDGTALYSEVTTSDSALDAQRNSQDVSANATYRLPGNAGDLRFIASQHAEQGARDGDNSVDSFLISQGLTLGRGSLRLEYGAGSTRSGSLLGFGSDTNTEVARIGYEISASEDLFLKSSWSQDIAVKDRASLREDTDRVRVEVAYSPDNWNYQLIVDSHSVNSRNVAAESSYFNQDIVTARVSFTF